VQFAAALKTADLPRVPSPWATARLPDGTTYLRRQHLSEFLIQPDGGSVVYRPLSDRAIDAFHTLLGPSLSFALINLGVEPQHPRWTSQIRPLIDTSKPAISDGRPKPVC
jgi:hypothetical protein